jgi:hypothetical protein
LRLNTSMRKSENGKVWNYITVHHSMKAVYLILGQSHLRNMPQ